MYKITEVMLNDDGTLNLLVEHLAYKFEIINVKIESLDSWVNCINAPNPDYPNLDYKYAGKRHYAIDTSCEYWTIEPVKI